MAAASSTALRSVWGWGTSYETEEERAFLAQRVALYARQVGLFFAMLYAIGIVLSAILLPSRMLAIHLHPAKIANLALIFLAWGVWWAVRRPNRSPYALLAGDALLPLLVTLGGAYAAPYAPPGFALTFVPMLIAVLALMFRAALIPSPPARTAWVGIVACIPTIWAQYELAVREPNLPGPLTATVIGFGCTAWCVALTAGTALVSREIYGLRTAVVKAQRLGQYTIERLVGEGGMGAVYVARHARLRRPTALKLLLPERTGPESIARFEREVQLTSQLTHPNTVAVYDYGRTPDGVFYYAMEYIDGLSLAQLVDEQGPQPAGRVIHILIQAADALIEAHALGLIHRDVKPANILLCERAGSSDVVKLLDFGLVKDIRPNADPALTQTDTITGTPLYLAPETITDPSQIDHRVDLYALGAVGYCLLTGAPPFQGRSTVEVCGHHLHSIPPAPSERLGIRLPGSLDAVLLRCLAKQPGDRPANARELQQLLRECAKEAPWSDSDARTFWDSWRASASKRSNLGHAGRASASVEPGDVVADARRA
jgi:eukaryotic-like serine/threonine-protein kinase